MSRWSRLPVIGALMVLCARYSFTRRTVLVPTPRTLAMANIPLPAVIDFGCVFPRWGRSSGARAVCPLAHPARLARAAPSGAPTVRLVVFADCLGRPGPSRSRIIKVWWASFDQIGGIERSHARTLDCRSDLRDRSRRFGFRSTVPPRYTSANRAAGGNIQRPIQQARRRCYRRHVH
jgi:hypothetical protein